MWSPPLSPPALFFLSILAMEALHILLPGPRFLSMPFTLSGVLPVLLGMRIHSSATRLFRRRGTTLATLASPGTLVSDGPFRLTRNPMYLAGVVILLGIGIFLGTASSLLVPPLFGLLSHFRFIRPEESLLRKEFGEEYEAYVARVRPWI